VKLLIDADTILYKGLFVCEGYFAGLRACDNIIYNILDHFDNPPFELVLTGENNFRKKIYPQYKANRKPESRPRYLYDAKRYYLKYWGAVLTDGEEADDYIARNSDGAIIVADDKDYLQTGTPIFNPRKWELLEGYDPYYYFWLQCLTGDHVDNVPGLPNPAKAHWAKPPCFTDTTAPPLLEGKSKDEMKQTVLDLYREVYGERAFEEFDLRARLLFLRRKDHKDYSSWI